MLKIGNLSLSIPVMLSPMAGISSYPYRMLNRKMGFQFAYLEMISARALSYLSPRTKEILRTGPKDRPLGVQLLGKDREYILRAIDRLNDYSFDILDFNAACPQKKITNSGKGAYLLKEPKKLNSLLKCIVENISKPLILKMRLGWENSNDALKIALGAEDSGVTAICVHGRTKVQGYKKGIDYDTIAKIKRIIKIPIIASGDILTAMLTKKMFDLTGVDGVMVARGALGNPWIFEEIQELLQNNRIIKRPGINTITNLMKEHLSFCGDFYGEKRGVVKFRKFYIWYTRSFTETKPLRVKIAHAKTEKEMCDLILDFANIVKNN